MPVNTNTTNIVNIDTIIDLVKKNLGAPIPVLDDESDTYYYNYFDIINIEITSHKLYQLTHLPEMQSETNLKICIGWIGIHMWNSMWIQWININSYQNGQPNSSQLPKFQDKLKQVLREITHFEQLIKDLDPGWNSGSKDPMTLYDKLKISNQSYWDDLHASINELNNPIPQDVLIGTSAISGENWIDMIYGADSLNPFYVAMTDIDSDLNGMQMFNADEVNSYIHDQISEINKKLSLTTTDGNIKRPL